MCIQYMYITATICHPMHMYSLHVHVHVHCITTVFAHVHVHEHVHCTLLLVHVHYTCTCTCIVMKMYMYKPERNTCTMYMYIYELISNLAHIVNDLMTLKVHVHVYTCIYMATNHEPCIAVENSAIGLLCVPPLGQQSPGHNIMPRLQQPLHVLASNVSCHWTVLCVCCSVYAALCMLLCVCCTWHNGLALLFVLLYM